MAKSVTATPAKSTTPKAPVKTVKNTKKTQPTKQQESVKKSSVVTKKKTTVQTKPVTNTTTPSFSVFATNLLKTWIDGWKNTFNLSGRSSRFELWGFLLLNTMLMVIIQLRCAYVMSERYVLEATKRGMGLEILDRNIVTAEVFFYLTIFIPMFPLVSLLVRRLHDLGKVAWANYFEPLFMSVVVTNILFVALLEIEKTNYAYTMLCLGICFITMLYAAGFHGLKILTMTMFYRGQSTTNDFGASQFNDEEHEIQALNLSCIWFLFIITIGLLYLLTAIA